MKDINGLPLIATGARQISFVLRMMNRHGLIAGATGTGKTISLQVMAEAFSTMGVPVFLADVKGDLGGIGHPGGTASKVVEKKPEPANPMTGILADFAQTAGRTMTRTLSAEIGRQLVRGILGGIFGSPRSRRR